MDKEKTLELTNDYIFKRVFSKKGNEEILKDLLESILEIPIKKIEVIQEAKIDKVNIGDKIGVIDLKATVNENTTIDIEMQVKNYHNMVERSLFYVAGVYHTGLEEGEKYEKNNKVIGINIVEFNIFKWKKYHSKGMLIEEELKEAITDKIEIHFIEIPKFLNSKEEGNKKLRQWLYFLSNKRKGEIEMAVKENEKIAKAKEEYEYLTGDAEVQRLAYLRERWERDHNSEIAWEKDKSKREGVEEGKKEGIKEATESIIIEMIKNGISDKTIIEVTKISQGVLEKIREKIEK